MPTGTMANQIALLLHCRPGDEVIVGRGAHVRLYESGAGAAWAGVQFAEIGAERRNLRRGRGRCRPCLPGRSQSPPQPPGRGREHAQPRRRARLAARAGGSRSWRRARTHGLALHLDGARIWNAAVASGAPERDLAAPFDTVSACFSKGLGAPVGSALAGTADAIEAARRFRKMLGGGMRQAGVLAAAALYALDHHRARLADDHAKARRLAEGLADIAGDRDRRPRASRPTS